VKDPTSNEAVPLVGGNVSTVVRVGDTVRRTTGPWSPAVHELLLHLEAVGFSYAPRFLGIDERGREVLTFIPGETVGVTEPWPQWAWSDETLTQVAHILRDYHAAVETFRLSQPMVWRFVTAAVGAGEVVCHNDVAPYNLVMRDGRVVGIIDWDLAAPAAPTADLAFAAWTFAPIMTNAHELMLGGPSDVVRRLRLLCDTYGLEDRTGFVDEIAVRMRASIEGVEAKAAAGEDAFVRLVRDGHLARMKADAQLLAQHRAEWAQQL